MSSFLETRSIHVKIFHIISKYRGGSFTKDIEQTGSGIAVS